VLLGFWRYKQRNPIDLRQAALLGLSAAVSAYASAGKVNWGLGLPMAAGGLLSVSWGVALAHSLPEQLLRMLFCAMLAATAWAMF